MTRYLWFDRNTDLHSALSHHKIIPLAYQYKDHVICLHSPNTDSYFGKLLIQVN